MRVIPVLLSGGSGTRLWPLSRRSRPKQFLRIRDGNSLFQETMRRVRTALYDPKPIVVASNDHRFLIAEDIHETGIEADILLEPVPRNSCAAIAVACLQAMSRDEEAVVLVLASDHLIEDRDAFAASVEQAIEDAVAGYLVTFGIKPAGPATGYGYISPGEKLKACNRVQKFREKPDATTAEKLVKQGYLWNSGNFLFSAKRFLEELQRTEPAVLASARTAFDKRSSDLDFLRLDEESFASAKSISVDHAVLEKTDRAAVLPVDYGWSDIGNWDAVTPLMSVDQNQNATQGDTVFFDSNTNVVHSEDRLSALVGVDNLVVVSTRDAVLIANRNRAEDVKSLVDQLREAGRTEADEGVQVFRPWGNYTQLDHGENYQVKRIQVNQGGILSLQKHQYRSEHWVVVSGEAHVEIDGESRILKPNESAYIPCGAVHRLINREEEPLVLIEVQTGSYLGEDDIIRLEDIYNRN